jgi:hypothetical protein
MFSIDYYFPSHQTPENKKKIKNHFTQKQQSLNKRIWPKGGFELKKFTKWGHEDRNQDPINNKTLISCYLYKNIKRKKEGERLL